MLEPDDSAVVAEHVAARQLAHLSDSGSWCSAHKLVGRSDAGSGLAGSTMVWRCGVDRAARIELCDVVGVKHRDEAAMHVGKQMRLIWRQEKQEQELRNGELRRSLRLESDFESLSGSRSKLSCLWQARPTDVAPRMTRARGLSRLDSGRLVMLLRDREPHAVDVDS